MELLKSLLPTTIILAVIYIITLIIKTKTASKETVENAELFKTNLPIKGYYQPKWLFSYNEKDAYRQLKVITDKYGLYLFAKVRLLDLVEPVKSNNPKYKTYFYKVQAKHVDFVICNEKLVAKLIIELDDSSHDTENRQERDKFVDEVLTSTGYKIIHTRAINEAEIKTTIQEIITI